MFYFGSEERFELLILIMRKGRRQTKSSITHVMEKPCQIMKIMTISTCFPLATDQIDTHVRKRTPCNKFNITINSYNQFQYFFQCS